MLDKLDAEFAFGRQALDVRAYRQELLSSNIANADTPGYQARDVSFSSTLARSLKQAGGGLAPSNAAPLAMAQPAGMTMASTAQGHMAGTVQLIPTGGPSDSYGRPQYRQPTQPALDGNTVELDVERVQFADNALHYESGMTVMTQQIKAMIAAITSNS